MLTSSSAFLPTGGQIYSLPPDDLIVAQMLDALDASYYPTQIVSSTVFDIFEMYAQQLATASMLTRQAWLDIALQSVETTLVANRSTPKLYDNFAWYFQLQRVSGQYYDQYNSGATLNSYRQQLRLLYEADFAGTVKQAIQRVGQAFTGMSPIIIQPELDRNYWNLTILSGNIVALGPDYLVSDTYIPNFGYKIPCNVTSFATASRFVISYSRLGSNTEVISNKHKYSAITIFQPATSTITGSLQPLYASSINKVLRGDIYTNIFFIQDYVFSRPSSSSSVYVFASGGYITTDTTNYGPGQYLYDPAQTLQLPSNYKSLDWYLDWLVLTRNGSSYTMQLRSYASASIPSTVYYRDYNPQEIPYITMPASTTLGAHWLFTNSGSILDVTPNKNTLSYISGGRAAYGHARRARDFAATFNSSSVYSASVNFGLTPYIGGQFWLYGVDSGLSTTTKWMYKMCAVADNTFSLSSSGLMLLVDASQKQFSLTVNSGTTQLLYLSTLAGGPPSIFNELPSRYHQIAFTVTANESYLYIDGAIVASGSGVVLPSLTSTTAIMAITGSAITMDEALVANYFLTPLRAQQDFQQYKPRLTSLCIPSSSVEQYWQYRLLGNISASAELEFHQFSMIGLSDQMLYQFGVNGVYNTQRLPVFPR